MPHTDDLIPRGFRPANDNQEQEEGGIQTEPTTSSNKERTRHLHRACHLSQQTKNQASKQTLPSLPTNKKPGIQTDPTIFSNKQRTRHPNRPYHHFNQRKKEASTYWGAYHLFIHNNQHEEEKSFSEKLIKSVLIVFGIVIKLIPICICIVLISTYGRSCK
jgi:hypothetical protein